MDMSAVAAKPAAQQAGGASIVLPGQSPDGGHVLSVLLKRTYDILPRQICTRSKADRPLCPGDVFWDSPMNSSVRFESDFVPFKLATDVVLNGRVYAPQGEPTLTCLASFRVGQAGRDIRVFGNRSARYVKDHQPVFTEPQPFTSMELRYERAYGGTDVYSDKTTTYAYPRNPLGRGFAVVNCSEAVDNLKLPNLEDPAALLKPETLCIGEFKNWENQPRPAGLGWLSKTWLQRAQMAGVLPADRATEREMRQAYAQLVPADQRQAYVENGLPDMDFRFFNGASDGLALPFLTGGEPVHTRNLSPDGDLSFLLPQDSPRIGLDIGSGVQAPEVTLHTVMIHMDERKVDLLWRGAVPYPGRDWLPQMRKMEVLIA